MAVMVCFLALALPGTSFGADYTFRWDANQELDLKGYWFHYSQTPGPPYEGVDADEGDSPIYVGNVTQFTIHGLSDTQAYYFALTAVDNDDLVSEYSTQVSINAPLLVSAVTVVDRTDTSAVIQWTTDRPGTSVVDFGTSVSYGQTQADLTFKTHHSVALSNLLPGRTYHFRVSSTDEDGLGPEASPTDNNPSTDATFQTETGADETSPQILSGPLVTDKTDTTVTVSWSTDEASNAQVRYGECGKSWETYANREPLTPGSNYKQDHVIILSSLTPNTPYCFMAGSVDPSGNGPTISNEVSVTTNAAQDNTAPVITGAPTVTQLTDTSARIAWVTNEPGDSIIQWGDTSTYGSENTQSAFVFNHSITLTGLDDAAVYHYRVGSTDEAGNGPTYSSDRTFTTLPTPDTTAPVITGGPTVTGITETTATITWNTDEPSNSQVHYELFSASWEAMSGVKNQADMVQSHRVTLTGLQENTLYYVRVGSTDAAGNGPATSGTDNNPSAMVSFRTQADQTAPVIVSAATVSGITDTTAIIQWDTDEPGNSQVRYADVQSQYDWNTYPLVKNSAALVTHHAVTLTGLEEAQAYYFRVGSTDVEGNGPDVTVTTDNNPSIAEFTFTTQADQTDPIITTPPTVTHKTHNTATIAWTTNEPANSLVQYGDNSAVWGAYDLTRNDGAMVTSHSVTITGLDDLKKYYFRVGSTDLEGNGPVISNQGFFTTLEAPDVIAPVITSPPTVTDITYTTATISWETDEPANSLVRFDTGQVPWSSLDSSQSSAIMTTQHHVTLTGLSNGQRYYFQVANTDADGNGPDTDIGDNNPFSRSSFVTTQAPDEDAPFIDNIQVSGQDNASAIITWDTDEPANSMVKVGTTTGTWATYSLVYSDPAMATRHTVVVSGLQPDTDYWFRVGSVDALGNGPDWNPGATNPSIEGTFVTDEGPDVSAPNIVAGPTLAHITNMTALIEWETDEPSNSQVAFGLSNEAWEDLTFYEADLTLTTLHSVTITVQPETTYYVRVGATDLHGNGPDLSADDQNPSDPALRFVSDSGPDQTAPQIYNVAVSDVTDTTAKVTWETDEPGNSQVQYDVDSRSWDNYSLSENDGGLTTQHSVILTGLTPATIYYLRVSSTDASGNTHETSTRDVNPSIEHDLKTQGKIAPFVKVYPDEDAPYVDPANDVIDITFSEPNMQGAWDRANYQFDAMEIDAVTHVGGETYRFSFDDVPENTVFLLTLSPEITDADGFALTSLKVVINDSDSDDLPDDWESDQGLDPTSASGDNGKYGDADGDGASNYEEFVYNSHPLDTNDVPGQKTILASVPADMAGIDDAALVPAIASFGVLIADSEGVVLQGDNVLFQVDQGDGTFDDVSLGTYPGLRIVRIDDSTEDAAVAFWAIYDPIDESTDPASFGFMPGAQVTIKVSVTNMQDDVVSQVYHFQVQSILERDAATLPPTTVLDASDSDMDAVFDKGIQLNTGGSAGAKILFSEDVQPVPPTFGPLGVLPVFDVSGVIPVGASINLAPPTVFDAPIKLKIPCPGEETADTVDIYLFNGEAWVLAHDAARGEVQAGGYGWIVPGSRNDRNHDLPLPSIEFQVYHFSGVQLGVADASSIGGDLSNPGGGGDSKPEDAAEATCFIDALMGR